MSCFSCNMCTCTLTTQMKTQLIVYPVQLQSSNKQVLKNCNLKVKKNRESGDNGKQSQCASEGEKGSGKEKEVGDTMHTVSKIVSVGSLQLPKDKAQIYIVDQNSNQQERQSQLGQESCLQDKQNINSNLSSLILSPHPRILNPLSLQLQPKLAQSHLTSLLSPQLPKSPHPSSSFSPSLLQSPSLSSITQKNLQSILLQKQNTQLKQQLSRLKQVQKQLLQQQLKIRQKSNREIGHLKRKSQELEKSSQKREKELGELRDMMRIVRGRRQGKDTGKREKGNE